jgi:hypothetical protein
MIKKTEIHTIIEIDPIIVLRRKAIMVLMYTLVKMPPAFSLTVRVPIVPGMAEGTFPNIVFHTMP